MSLQISRSDSLSTLPYRKIIRSLENTIKECDTCSQTKPTLDNVCQKCRTINTAKQRYAKSNIPIRYWDLDMTRDFYGDSILSEKYKFLTENIHNTYNEGDCLCFAGGHGVGKTMLLTNVLKRACEKGYNCLYTTLSDIVEMVVGTQNHDKVIARKELLMVDFLVIEEFDPRHMGTVNASDLFGRTLENVFRTRAQNTLPLFMSTNSPNVIESFAGPVKDSIESLMNYVEIVPVLGEDFRKEYKA